MLRLQKTITVIAVLSGAIIISSNTLKPKKQTPGFENLKVLPADISSKQLTKIMVDVFTDELGVSCNYCHAENKSTGKLDYASDEKSEKEIARSMMKMTIGINTQYFALKNFMVGDSIKAISCGTCHHGVIHPDETLLNFNLIEKRYASRQ